MNALRRHLAAQLRRSALDERGLVRPLVLARQQALLAATLGLACGILYSFGGLALDAAGTLCWQGAGSTLGLGTVLAFMALVGMPALFAAIGFTLGLAAALLLRLAMRPHPRQGAKA